MGWFKNTLWLQYLLCCVFFNSHENSSGFYRVSAYYFAKVIGDILPLRIIPIPLFSCIAYWLIGKALYNYILYNIVDGFICMVLFVSGLQPNAGNFFLFMFALFGQNMAASGLVYFLGAAIGVFAVAQTSFSVTVVFSMVRHNLYYIIIKFIVNIHFF